MHPPPLRRRKMAEREVGYSLLCALGDPAYTPYKDGKWGVNEVELNLEYCNAGNSGASFQRVMPWTVWGPHPEGMKSQFSPYILEGDKFNLGKFNDYYFPIVRRVVMIAKSYGIKTYFDLTDNCQFIPKTAEYRKWSPWVTNVQGITSVYDGSVGKDANGNRVLKGSYLYFDMFIEKCIAELGGEVAGFFWGNETNNGLFRPLANAVIFPWYQKGKLTFKTSAYGATMDACDKWGINPVTNKYEYLCPENSVQDLLKKDVGAVFGEKAKLSIWKEVHSIGEVEPDVNPPHPLHQALFWWGNHPIRIFLSDDGVFRGDSKCDIEPETEHTRPSAERWGRVINHCLGYRNDFYWEHLPKGGYIECQGRTLQEMYKALNGKYPVKKYHYEPPVVPPPIPPAPTEVPITVCKSSGLLPTEWCPVKETRMFPVGSVLTYCREHYKPCSYFIKRWNIWGWLKCVLFGKH
jgi:hypothetical protein